MRDIVLVTNSPGELSTWAQILAERLKEKAGGKIRIVVALVPCPFSTGREEIIASGYKDVDKVFSPSDYTKFLLFNRVPNGIVPSKMGIVVFLGGDYWHAKFIAKRLDYPAVAYATRPFTRGSESFKYIFCPTENLKNKLIKKGVSQDKLKTVGHLLVEGVKPEYTKEEAYSKWNLNPDLFTIGIFPGSRLYNLEDALPVFIKSVDEIKALENNVQFLLGLSPFVKEEDINNCFKNSKTKTGLKGGTGSLKRVNGDLVFVTGKGNILKVLKSYPYDLMNLSDFIMTIPGSNTAQSAFMGCPSIVAYSWRARCAPVGAGIFMNFIPVSSFRRYLMHMVFKKIKYAALPNILAGEMVIPEVRIEESSEEVTRVAIDLLRNKEKLILMGEKLKRVMGRAGAADKITNVILKLLKL